MNTNHSKVILSREISLVEHFRKAGIKIPDPRQCGWRNLYFAWAHLNDQLIYIDSDGFIIAAAEEKYPDLPPLVTPGYWVARSKRSEDEAEAEAGESRSYGTMLTNFQMNMLLEGVWNSAADPRVFLLSGNKSREIEENFAFERLQAELMVKMDGVTVDTSAPFPIAVRRLIFLQAIRSMRNGHMLPLKWNIEAARRHLFSETMTMLHRPESLKQYAPLSAITEESAVTEEGTAAAAQEATNHSGAVREGQTADSDESDVTRDQLFAQSSDEQLRGYVMLISAKLPLIDNLTFLIGDCWEGLALDSEVNSSQDPGSEPDRQGIPRVVRDVVTTWQGTAEALHKNVEALERSFANIWQDKLLHETEQVRVEEEALGELQRQQARAKSDRWFDTMIFVVTLAIAGAALYFSINGAEPVKNHKAALFVFAGIMVVIIAVVFWIIPKVFSRWAGEYLPRYELVARLDEPLMTGPGNKLAYDWMDIPFRERLHKAVSGDSEEAGYGAANEAAEDGAANKAAVSLALANRRCSRFFSTKKMRAWIGLPCYMAKLSSSAEFEYYPVGVFLDDEAPKARVDSPGEIDTYCRIHLDIKLLLPSLRRFTRLDRGAEHSSILGKFTRWELAARHSKREPDHSREYRPALRRFTGWRKRLFGTYLATFPKRSVTIECAVELHKHSPDSSGLGLYFLRELRIIMSSRMELRREETLMATLITDFLLVAPWVHPYSESEERRVDVRRSLLTDRLENVGWQGSVIHPPKAPSNPKAASI